MNFALFFFLWKKNCNFIGVFCVILTNIFEQPKTHQSSENASKYEEIDLIEWLY